MKHGTRGQVIAAPKRRLLWTSPALAGAALVPAARERGITNALAEVGITCGADKG